MHFLNEQERSRLKEPHKRECVWFRIPITKFRGAVMGLFEALSTAQEESTLSHALGTLKSNKISIRDNLWFNVSSSFWIILESKSGSKEPKNPLKFNSEIVSKGDSSPPPARGCQISCHGRIDSSLNPTLKSRNLKLSHPFNFSQYNRKLPEEMHRHIF